MFSKKLTSISIATLATLGAFAMSAESASAKGLKVHIGFGHHHGHWGHGHYRPWRYYATPVVYSTYVRECVYVRRFGKLFKVCE
jgi:hypothetical protein